MTRLTLPKGALHSWSCGGDSLTDYRNGHPFLANFNYTAQLNRQLGGLPGHPGEGCRVLVRNFGVSGNGSQDLINRADCFHWYDTPTVCSYFIGVNDPGKSLTQNQTQANIQTLILIGKHGVKGLGLGTLQTTQNGSITFPQSTITVLSTAGFPRQGMLTIADQVITYTGRTLTTFTGCTGGSGSSASGPVKLIPCTAPTPAALPPGGRSGQRFVVLADSNSDGGTPADLNAVTAGRQVPSLNGAGGGVQAVWECRNPLAGVYGWGRVAVSHTANAAAPVATTQSSPGTIPWKTPWHFVIGAQYLPYSSGGDTLSVAYAPYVPVRAAQVAAAAAENVNDTQGATVIYADLYNLEKNRIVAGLDPDFTAVSYDQTRSNIVADNNQHPSPAGHRRVVEVLRASMTPTMIAQLSA